MRVLFLEPFFGGSHKDFALGFKAHSRHDVDLLTLPARFWKWRMRGAALAFLTKVADVASYDAVFATDMMDLTDFIGLAGKRVPPILMYFHENQLSYPLSPGEKRDFHLGFTNIVSAAAADQVMFNSQFHYRSFVRDATALIRKMPDYRPEELMDQIDKKTAVAYPGCRFETGEVGMDDKWTDPPLIVWNHRWEHDKNPEAFFKAMEVLEENQVRFFLAILGENYEKSPPVFQSAQQRFKDKIKVFGFAESRSEYVSWLKRGAVVISCANQENFGISVVEAVRYGCLPLLPDRLSYPELIPHQYQSTAIYHAHEDLVKKLNSLLADYDKFKPLQSDLSRHMEQFSWQCRIKQYDDALDNMKRKPSNSGS